MDFSFLRDDPEPAEQTSLTPDGYAEYRRTLESGGKANAKNPASSAFGADQFINSTWLDTVRKAQPEWARGMSEAELLAQRSNPERSGEMAAALDRENAATLQGAGQPVNRHTLYASHHFGAGRGVEFARARDDTPMSDILSPAQMRANRYLQGMTKAEAIQNWDRRAGQVGVAEQVTPQQKPENPFAFLSGPGIYTPKVETPPEPETWTGHFGRGLKNYMPQTKAMINAAETMLGQAFKSAGVDGVGDWMVQDGLAGFDAAMQEVKGEATDSFSEAWDQGGVLSRWLPYQLGQTFGNIAESLTVAGAGALVGGAVGSSVAPGVGSAAGAASGLLTGLTVKMLGRGAMMKFAEISAKDGAEAGAKFLAKEIGKKKGMTAAMVLQAGAHGMGETAQNVLSHAKENGIDLDQVDLSRWAASSAGHAGLEFIGNLILLKGLGGEGAYRAAGTGFGPALKTIAGNVGKVSAGEVPVEMGQTGLERFAAGESLTDEEARREYIDAAAAAATFGIAGVPGGVRAHMTGDPRGTGAMEVPKPTDPIAEAAEQPNSPLSRAVMTVRQGDNIAQRAAEIEQQVRDGDLLQRLRDIGNPEANTAGEFLEALATAKNPGASTAVRQMALDSMEAAIGWIEAGAMPRDEATGRPFSTDLTVPGDDSGEGPGGGAALPGPRALPAPVIETPMADVVEPNQAAPESDAMRDVPMPATRTPAGEGAAASRRRAAQLRAMVEDGFTTVERDGDFWYLVNNARRERTRLDNALEAKRADQVIKQFVEAQARTAATHPENSRPEPTDAQKEAGNYKKSEPIQVAGLSVKLENPAGSVRSGIGADGQRWENTLAHHYGDIAGVPGIDGDLMDAFIGPNPASNRIFVIDQIDERGRMDEHKVMLGFDNEADARAGYLANYDDGWQGLGAITEMTPQQFQAWAKSDAAKLPAQDADLTGAQDAGQSTDARTADRDAGADQDGDRGARDIPAGDAGQRAAVPDADSAGVAGDRSVAAAAERDQRAVERAQRNPEINDPTLRVAGQSAEADALRALLHAAEQVFGVRGVAYEADQRSPAGRADGFMSNGTVFVNVRDPSMHVAQTIGHELAHTQEASMVALRNRLWDLFSEDGRRAYYEGYMAKGQSYDAITVEDMARLKSEMLADFMGNRFHDEAWLRSLAQQRPHLFGNFVRDWLRMLQALVDTLKSLAGSISPRSAKLVDQYVTDLEQAKNLAVLIASDWAQRHKGMAQRQGVKRVLDEMRQAPKVDAAQQRREFAESERRRTAPGSRARANAAAANPFRAFLGEHGISLDLRSEFAPGRTEQRAAMVPGYGPIFRRTGLSLDALTERAVEAGFLVRHDANELYDLINRVLRGERIIPQYAEGTAESEMEAMVARQREMEAEQQSEPDIPLDPESMTRHEDGAAIPFSVRDAYTRDLFGGAVDWSPAESRAATLADTPAPEGDYIIRTVVGVDTERRMGASTINSLEDLATATQYLYRSAVERLDAVVTDEAGNPLAVVGGFKGALAQTSVYPGTIAAEAVRVPGAARIWFSHNHPSGFSMLSTADKRLYETLHDAFRGSGIEPMGLIAVAGGEYHAVDGHGDAGGGTIRPAEDGVTIPVIEREQLPPKSSLVALDGVAAAKRVAGETYSQAKAPGMMLLNSQHQVIGWVPIPVAMRGNLRGTGQLQSVYRAISEANAGSVVLVHGGELSQTHPGSSGVTVGQNIAAALQRIDVRTLDIIDAVTHRSLAEIGEDIAMGPVFSMRDVETQEADWDDFREALAQYPTNAPEFENSHVTAAEIKAQGLMAERAFGDLKWERDGDNLKVDSPDSAARVAKVPGGYSFQGQLGTYLQAPTQKIAKEYATRQEAGAYLTARGFDLADTLPADIRARLVESWRGIAESPEAMRLGDVTDEARSLADVIKQLGLPEGWDVRVTASKEAGGVVIVAEFTRDGEKQTGILDIAPVNGRLQAVSQTTGMQTGGMGALFYQAAAQVMSRKGIPLAPDWGISGINAYRRTEQQISAALRTGVSTAMLPHDAQRVYGFNDHASTPEEHEANMARLMLAGLRNAREIAPEIADLVYHPQSDEFVDRQGDSAEDRVAGILRRQDARAFGLGRSTLARAALTQQMLAGEAVATDEFAAPVLYSRRDLSPEQRAENLEAFRDGADYVTSEDAQDHEFKSGEPVMVDAFHGTGRPDRVGNVFSRQRATSGPMAFFTSSPELASNYAQGKRDTSLDYEDAHYSTWFKVKIPGQRTPVSIDRAWYFLTPSQRQTIAERMGDIGTDDDGNIVTGAGTNGIGNYEWELRQTRTSFDSGNPLKAAVESWLTSGALFGEEEKFMEVLQKAGMPMKSVEFDSPNATYPAVYKTFIRMDRPLVTSDIPERVVDALNEAAKRSRQSRRLAGSDLWDKNQWTLRDWVQMFNENHGPNSMVWTSIPDKVTAVLKEQGFDGIIDSSGKGGGDVHPVYIPFAETQVKSALGNRGTYDRAKKNILFSTRDDSEPVRVARDVDPATLLFREEDQADYRVQAIRDRYPDGNYPAVVAARTDDGQLILDGHHRVTAALEDGHGIDVVSIPADVYRALTEAGLDEVDIAHGALTYADQDDAASDLRQQFNGVNWAETEKQVWDAIERVGIRSFREADYRPGLVTWAREKFGDTEAPNGAPVWQNFLRWFGDSQAVDGKGNPLVVYHGSPDARFVDDDGTFRSVKNRLGMTDDRHGAFWFSKSRRVASTYADERRAFDYGAAESGIVDAYLSLQNPLVVDAKGQAWRDAQQRGKTRDIIDEALEAGHDGVIVRNVRDDYSSFEGNRTGTATDTYTVFLPNQIKSVDNNGNFDRESDSIVFSARDEAQTNTPEFRRWFDGSQVVDEAGRPLVVYHGTRAKDAIAAFDLSKAGSNTDDGWMGLGFYFGDSATADAYAGVAWYDPEHFPHGGAVYPAYLSIRNPARLNGWETGDATQENMVRRMAGLPEGATARQVRDALIDAGYDGVIYERTPGGYKEYAAFHPEQVKSAVGNSGAFDPNNPDVRFSRRVTTGDMGRSYTPEQRQMFENTGRTVERKTIVERAKEFRKDIWKKMAQGIVDQFRPIKDLSRHAYALARLAKGASGAFEALLQHGKLKIVDGVYDADMTGGFQEVVGVPLGVELDDFVWWVAANRAEGLKAEGRENLFSDADIAAGKSLATGQMDHDYTMQNGQVTRDRALVYQDSLEKLNAFHKNVLDIAEQSGLIDGSTRPYWEGEFYVPFYRVSEEDGGFIGDKIKGGLARQRAFQSLKGGQQKLNADLVQNMLQNWAHLIDASAKNRAAKETMEAALQAGIAIEASQELVRQLGKQAGQGSGTAWIMDDGQQRHFLIEDPYLLEALNSLSYAGLRGPMMDALSKAKHWLTLGVTASPGFKVRNLIRDSLQAIATADMNYNPVTNIRQGIELTRKDNQIYVSALASGGLIRFGTAEASQADVIRRLARAGVPSSQVLDSWDKVQSFYDRHLKRAVDAYQELGSRGEEINRAALYKQLIDKGVSPSQAALEARDLMDFSMQGTWGTIRFLTQVVPFLNARLQGLYKLGRAGAEDRRRMATVLGATALASVALLALYHDDDDWRQREEWDRDQFWWFKFGGVAFRIPKPFEVGAIASVAERGVELFVNDEFTMQRFMDRMKHLASDNLSMDPIPQALKPLLDVYSNVDSFTGRPIESMGMERLQAEYRYGSYTSLVARGLSTAMNTVSRNVVGEEALSPVQIDHLVRGYFGWLGTLAITTSDQMLRPLSSEPVRPGWDWLKVVTQGMSHSLPAPQSKYVSAVYEQSQELDRVQATYRRMVQEGKLDDAKKFAKENADDLRRQKQVAKVRDLMSKSNKRVRDIERSTTMTAAEKRDAILQERQRQSRIAAEVY